MILIVTGTGTGVGKTVVTAAVAALARERGARVAVVKPAQTGLGADEPGDVAEVSRLSGVDDLHEWARFPDPLAPEAAARACGQEPLRTPDVVRRLRDLEDRDLVLVEGAGGLLVRFDDTGGTIADVARELDAELLVVVRPGLGTLNETALTLEVMAARGLRLAGLVIGAWPERPDLAMRSNVADLERLAGAPLAGVVTAGAAELETEAFALAAREWLGPALGGRFDAAGFRDHWGSAEEPG